ncbi:MAG: indole-3-glycerol phosphate synthase [Planctomycetota bacterium]|jgi:indole-3-glycerol phosphate synthase
MFSERLKPIMTAVAQRSAERRKQKSLADLRAELEVDSLRAENFKHSLRTPGLAFIAECKRRAPSTGELSTEVDLDARIRAYKQGGAAALSILTEQDFFSGELADLRAAPEVDLPRLRKDFVIDEGMVLEAQLGGASAVLLIAACLTPTQLRELREVARSIGIATLVEVHNEQELEIALQVDSDALGVNSRNLTTFEIDLDVGLRMLPQIPTDVVRIAESGLNNLKDLRRAMDAGADAALVGTALMRSDDPSALLLSWKEALNV